MHTITNTCTDAVCFIPSSVLFSDSVDRERFVSDGCDVCQNQNRETIIKSNTQVQIDTHTHREREREREYKKLCLISGIIIFNISRADFNIVNSDRAEQKFDWRLKGGNAANSL